MVCLPLDVRDQTIKKQISNSLINGFCCLLDRDDKDLHYFHDHDHSSVAQERLLCLAGHRGHYYYL